MEEQELKKKLTSRHIFFIALGSAIGTGLFYGAAEGIKLAGPSVLLAYFIGGIVIFMVMRALGEMVLYKSISDSFAGYASRYLNPVFGFITGWMYVLEMILVCLADVTAFSIYMKFWYPDVSPWIWSLGITLVIGAINLFSVKIFAEVEFFLTLLKIIAIFLMIAGGCILLFGNFEGFESSNINNLWINGGFMPNGISGFISSFAIVMFAFGGIEIIGLAAGETRNPDKDIPRAINSVPFRILFFYVLVLGVILCLFPWNKIGTEGSPFVVIFENLHIEFAAHVLNVVVIVAAISAINSDVYGAVRMMYGLAKQKQAPSFLTRLTSHSVPIAGISAMIFFLLIGVVLNYFIHDILFFMIAAIATFVTIWVWLIILFAEFFMRYKMPKEEKEKLKFKMPFWPITPILTIIFMFFVIGVLGYFEETRISLFIGILLVIVLFISYWLMNKKK
ncbi:amino acid permease [Apibacter sp. HY039]|uniref:amino acid permease n=1 Tax=Apibacter sp. HY039 TaxID=2501476 RepID=UPI000FEBF5F1|nr:amino acid permease [Apibacter sp. HY039]